MSEAQAPWVHVYEFDVGSPPGSDAWDVLSAEERRRAADIPERLVRQRFVARRSARRMCLAGYAGRPTWVSSSDSGEVAVLAVASLPVGIDIEIERPRRALERIAERMFTPQERSILDAADGDRRLGLFHRCWVAKEAYAKGRGLGLALPFGGFSVAAALGSAGGAGHVEGKWHVAVATHGRAHLAVAAAGPGWRIERGPAVPPVEAGVA